MSDSFKMQLIGTALSLGVTIIVSYWALKVMERMTSSAKKTEPDSKQQRIMEDRLKTNGQLRANLTTYELQIAAAIVDPSQIEVTFDDIGGLETVKNDLHEIVILPLERPDLFEGKGSNLLGYPKGILLHGPPGTGKTMLAKAIAKQSKSVFLNIQASTLMNMWYGETNKLVAAVFSLAEKLQPCIIFIDEMESFFKTRGRSAESEAGSLAKTEFMSLWDGLVTAPKKRLLVIGASNRPDDIDPAILRRMPRHFKVPMPDERQRRAILNVILKNEMMDEKIDVGELARRTKGFSGSDLKELCTAAAQVSVRDFIREESLFKQGKTATAPTAVRGLLFSDFEHALAVSPSRMQPETDFSSFPAHHSVYNTESD